MLATAGGLDAAGRHHAGCVAGGARRPTSGLVEWLQHPTFSFGVMAVVLALASAGLCLGLLLQAVALRTLGRVRPGVWSQWSLEAIRIWVKTGVVDSASRWLSGAVFWPWWLRLAGMRIGRRCEISTIIDVVPETVAIGDESFFADGIYLCGPAAPGDGHRCRKLARAEHVSGKPRGGSEREAAGRKACSWAFRPWRTRTRGQPGAAWFGHPPMQLPRRQVVTADRQLTYEPSPVRYVTRVFWELLRFTLPALPILVACAWYWLLAAAAEHAGGACWPSASRRCCPLGAGLTLCLAVVALKWGLWAACGRDSIRSGRAGAGVGISCMSPGAIGRAGRWPRWRARCC